MLVCVFKVQYSIISWGFCVCVYMCWEWGMSVCVCVREAVEWMDVTATYSTHNSLFSQVLTKITGTTCWLSAGRMIKRLRVRILEEQQGNFLF